MRDTPDGPDFAHAIVTRFNIATPGREAKIRNNPDWLDGRFELFEKYCLPSVAAQTNRNFTWIILFDAETPDSARAKIRAHQEIFPFKAIFTPLFTGEKWVEFVRSSLESEPAWLLTTRLDNDDSLARDYVERMHAAVRKGPAERAAYNFTNGLILSGASLYRIAHESNAFFSILEKCDDKAATASGIQHMELGAEAEIVQLGGDPAWLQVVHGGNVSNKIRGVRDRGDAVETLFPGIVSQSDIDYDATTALFENAVLHPARSLRDAALDYGRRVVRALR